MTARRRFPRGITQRSLPSGALVWLVSMTYRGHRIKKHLGPVSALSLEDVVSKRNLLIADAIRDEEGIPTKRRARTLGDLAAAYQRSIAPGSERAKRTRQHLGHVLDVLGKGASVDALSMISLVRYRTVRLKQETAGHGKPHPVHLSTVNRELSTLRSAYNWARRHAPDLGIKTHVFGALSKDDRRTVFQREPISKDPRRVSDEDLVRQCAELPPPYRALPWFGLETGMRKKEVMRLDWSELHEAARPPYVRPTCTKSGHTRIVPLSDRAIAILPARAGSVSGPVWLGASGAPINNYTRAWIKARKRASLPSLSIHDLRHEWATRFSERGGDLRTLMEIGGWSDLSLVVRYAKPNLERALEVLNSR